MRTIAIADASGTLGWARDIDLTIEEAITWAENHNLTVIDTDSVTVFVQEPVDTCTHCGTTTFIVANGECFFCNVMTEADWPHTEHFEGMLKEMNE